MFQYFADLIEPACDYSAGHRHIFKKLGWGTKERRAVGIWDLRASECVARSQVHRSVLLRNHSGKCYGPHRISLTDDLASCRGGRTVSNHQEVDSGIFLDNRPDRPGQDLRPVPSAESSDESHDDLFLQAQRFSKCFALVMNCVRIKARYIDAIGFDQDLRGRDATRCQFISQWLRYHDHGVG